MFLLLLLLLSLYISSLRALHLNDEISVLQTEKKHMYLTKQRDYEINFFPLLANYHEET